MKEHPHSTLKKIWNFNCVNLNQILSSDCKRILLRMGKRRNDSSTSDIDVKDLKRYKAVEKSESEFVVVKSESVEVTEEMELYDVDTEVTVLPEVEQVYDEETLEDTVADYSIPVVAQEFPDCSGTALYIVKPTETACNDTIEVTALNADENSMSEDSPDNFVKLEENVSELQVQGIDLNITICDLIDILRSNSAIDEETAIKEVLLQDTQVLDLEKTLAHQCVKADGLVQVNLEVKSNADHSVSLNITDIVKSCDSDDAVEQRTEARHRQIRRYKAKEKRAATKAKASRWVASADFLQIAKTMNISSDTRLWSNDNVKSWLTWARNYFNLWELNVDEITLTGNDLHSLSLDELREILSIQSDENTFPIHLQVLRQCDVIAVEEEDNTVVEIPIQKITGRGNRTGNNGQVQLWQFLLELLLDIENQHIIEWVTDDGEFKLKDAERVAQLWGERKNKTTMNYEKMSRAMRYYYDIGMIEKVGGKRFTYKFVCDLRAMIGFSVSELRSIIYCPTNAIQLHDGEETSLKGQIEQIKAALRTPGSIKKIVPLIPIDAFRVIKQRTMEMVIQPEQSIKEIVI